ncbi:glycine zipper domain-containing protein [Candidatus Formimonas warabiya]|uniref:Glycine zipper domain-containing protein n=1 Tax=Formimonas warabiya TaxID=1761012 RepID=A0A3G1KUR7_FORW1|nr:glycine zipper domain-containing protein [Candidatus Formimonas warabiya]ATW26253.1 hypothetical protein DCMF_17145 [Candidatus Formimonas warabiya]
MKALGAIGEALSEASPLTLAALGVAALFGAPVIKSGLRTVGVATVKGALEVSDQLSGIVNQGRKQWDSIVSEARAYQVPYMENAAGATIGAGIGGAIGAGLGSMAGPGLGTTAGGGIGGAVGAMVGEELEDRAGGQNNQEMKTEAHTTKEELSGPKAGPKPKTVTKEEHKPGK